MHVHIKEEEAARTHRDVASELTLRHRLFVHGDAAVKIVDPPAGLGGGLDRLAVDGNGDVRQVAASDFRAVDGGQLLGAARNHLGV